MKRRSYNTEEPPVVNISAKPQCPASASSYPLPTPTASSTPPRQPTPARLHRQQLPDGKTWRRAPSTSRTAATGADSTTISNRPANPAASITPTPSNGLLLTTPEAVGWQGRQQTTPPHQCELPPAADACGMGHPTDKQRPPAVSASNRPQAKSMPSNTPVPTPAAACCETGWYTPPPRQAVAVR